MNDVEITVVGRFVPGVNIQNISERSQEYNETKEFVKKDLIRIFNFQFEYLYYENFTVERYKILAKNNIFDERCSICLESLTSKPFMEFVEEKTNIGCHIFHTSCINNNLSYVEKCLCCRRNRKKQKQISYSSWMFRW